jgi:hypothetical protein
MMIKNTGVLFVALYIATSPGIAQITLSGQTAAYFFKSAPTQSPRSLNYGRPSFGWQAYLFVDGHVTDNVAALGTVRVADNELIYFDYLAIRLTNLTPLQLNLQVGKFDLPFGNLGERRYPRRNPLFGLPLIYEYRTALPDHVTTEATVLASQGQGTGMRLLNLGVYDLGGMLFGSFDIVDYAFAVTSGTISSASYGTQNANSDLGKLVRVAVTPMTGCTIGAAYAWGAYLEEPDQPLARNINVNTYSQKSVELDVEISRGHAVVNGEAVYNTWPVPFDAGDKNFKVFGYYLEGKYTLMPRVYAALRVSGLHFGTTLVEQHEQPWDYDVTEWEGGVGYFFDRDVVLKLVRRETRIHGGSMPKDNLTVLQLAVAF